MTQQEFHQSVLERISVHSGFKIEINNRLPYIGIKKDDSDVFFVQESEAQEFLDDAQKLSETANVELEQAILFLLDSAGVI